MVVVARARQLNMVHLILGHWVLRLRGWAGVFDLLSGILLLRLLLVLLIVDY